MDKNKGFTLTKERFAFFSPSKRFCSAKAFTLIELLIVVVVIGILAGMIFIVIGGIEADARDRVRESDMRAIFTAMERYRREVIVGGGYMAIDGTGGVLVTTAIGEFLNPIPEDPLSTEATPIRYKAFTSPVNSVEFCVWAELEGGGFVAASEKGPRAMPAAPASLAACP